VAANAAVWANSTAATVVISAGRRVLR
jgi:hypothetical protein